MTRGDIFSRCFHIISESQKCKTVFIDAGIDRIVKIQFGATFPLPATYLLPNEPQRMLPVLHSSAAGNGHDVERPPWIPPSHRLESEVSVEQTASQTDVTALSSAADCARYDPNTRGSASVATGTPSNLILVHPQTREGHTPGLLPKHPMYLHRRNATRIRKARTLTPSDRSLQPEPTSDRASN